MGKRIYNISATNHTFSLLFEIVNLKFFAMKLIITMYLRIESWFDKNFSWFVTNGMKQNIA